MSHQPCYLRPPLKVPTFRTIASRKAAALLTHAGQRVKVLRDCNRPLETTVTILPWEMSNGAWVVGVAGLPGGQDCTRVTPL